RELTLQDAQGGDRDRQVHHGTGSETGDVECQRGGAVDVVLEHEQPDGAVEGVGEADPRDALVVPHEAEQQHRRPQHTDRRVPPTGVEVAHRRSRARVLRQVGPAHRTPHHRAALGRLPRPRYSSSLVGRAPPPGQRTRPGQRTPVTPSEEVICFWKTRNRITSGASAIVVAAITSVQLPAYWVCSAAVATVITFHSSAGAMISGHMKLFHWLTTVISSSVAMIGLFIGTITCHSRRSTPAPSMVAASSTSAGVERQFSRSRQIACGEPNMNGPTSPANVFFSPRAVIIEYSGMIVTTTGIISVATYTQNSVSRPGKSSWANAYAARIEETICPSTSTTTTCTVTAIGTMKLYSAENRVAKFSPVTGSGSVSGQLVLNWCGVLTAVSTENTNGPSISSAPATRNA